MPDMLRALKYILIFLILLVGVGALGRHALQPPPPLPIPEPGFTLESVVLVVPGKFHSKPVNIAVEGNRITRIEPAPPGPTQGYVLPGLVDAHMHGPPLPMPGERALFAFLHLYHGVTLARMAAGDALMRDEIRAGLYPGPRIYTCGPFFDGDPPLWPTSVVLTEPEQAVAAVDTLVDLISNARSRESLITATRALDRVLMTGHHVMPLYHSKVDRIAYWTHLRRPETVPLYGFQPDTWWSQPPANSR